ncbi:hypothetical protein FQR65_LT10628 [Abscondita terminalis]|nr:hypothetical protein FQR65_LT10628 [Abscondita terminalis]
MTSETVLFSPLDYVLFALLLFSSALVGIYFGCKKKHVKVDNDYLLGGRSLSVFPVSASLIASNVSGILLMALPADVYQFGASPLWCGVSIIVGVPLFIYIYMPVFLNSEYNTIFEYLEIRFDRKVRILSSIFFVSKVLLFNPILVFVPCLAFAQVTNFSLHAIIIIVCTVCIFYTTIGGLRAVVWVDTLQTFTMYISFFVVFGKGLIMNGGFTNMWVTSFKGDRVDIFNFNPDVTDRESFWTIVIGYIGLFLVTFAANQATTQRLMSVPTYAQAKKVVWIFFLGILITNTVTVLMGLLVYTHYSGCDPVTTQRILRYDQILPYFVLDIAKTLPGLPGLFIAGIFSGALSSLSTFLNSLSGVIYADFLLPFACIKNKNKDTVLKAIIVVTGLFCIVSVFIVEQLGGIVPLSACFVSITGGPLLGLFTLGMTTPRANSKSSLIGGVIGALFVTWIVIGNNYYRHLGAIEDNSKPASTLNCSIWSNASMTYVLSVFYTFDKITKVT